MTDHTPPVPAYRCLRIGWRGARRPASAAGGGWSFFTSGAGPGPRQRWQRPRTRLAYLRPPPRTCDLASSESPLDMRAPLNRVAPSNSCSGSQPQPAQHPSHRTLAEAHPKLAPDQLLDHGPGPERKSAAQLERVLAGDGAHQPLHLCRSQLGRAPRDRLGPQRSHAPAPKPAQPLVDDRAMKTQCSDHYFRALSSSHHPFHRPLPNLRQSGVRKAATVA